MVKLAQFDVRRICRRERTDICRRCQPKCASVEWSYIELLLSWQEAIDQRVVAEHNISARRRRRRRIRILRDILRRIEEVAFDYEIAIVESSECLGCVRYQDPNRNQLRYRSRCYPEYRGAAGYPVGCRRNRLA